MIDRLISFSIKNKLVIGFFTFALIFWGLYSFKQIPIDAVPDITNNQVQIITQAPTLATQEVEQYITFPIETSMANVPDVEEIRSISRFGLSVITVVFKEDVDIYLARQLISERLKSAESKIPAEFGSPELGPVTTGLGEVYQYVVRAKEGYQDSFSAMQLRTIHDWIVKRQLAGTQGVIEVSGWGGELKQYEVAINPEKINSFNISIAEVHRALELNNENTGGSYIEKKYNTYFLRGEGLVKNLRDIENIVVKNVDGYPILIRDIATVGYGAAPRYGAITWNGKGEVVGGQTLMLKGENSYEVVMAVKERIAEIQKSLPEGVIIEHFLDRSELIGRAIGTVRTNLIEGGLIVILVLVLLLGNFRGGLIVASVIPLSLLFAMGMMNLFGVSANLMSLGAIDFGLVVDGSVIIVEAIIHRLHSRFNGQTLTRAKMNEEVGKASIRIRSSAAFGEVIILIVYLPILALVGIEGKMFRPMAQTVAFAIAGALILSLTYVPMMSAAFLSKKISNKPSFSDRLIAKIQKLYHPLLQACIKRSKLVIGLAVLLFGMSVFTFNRLGGEFIPVLEEGDFALHQILPPGSSLKQSVEVSKKIQSTLLENFPEVETVVSKIGSSEIPTDPMPIEVGDIMVRMRPKSEWVSAQSKEEMFEKMEAVLSQIPGVEYEFTQPIQMRFNELIAGVREDIAIKIFGTNPAMLARKAQEAKSIIQNIEGVGDLRVESTQGLPQMTVKYDRNQIARYGLNIRDVNTTLRASFAGEVAGQVFEEERRFDLVVRFSKEHRDDMFDLKNLYVQTANGRPVPLSELAEIQYEDGPTQISREDTKRKIVIGVNARARDTESLVEEIQAKLDANLQLPPGYSIKYGGQYENLKEAKSRLYIAAPIALLLIFILLFLTFNSIRQALLIFAAIPFSAIGGVYALYMRDLPFSISAGIGFIALSGVAVLNGIVLIAYFNQLKSEGMNDIQERIFKGTEVRLRPVLMTAAVAALGFLPMAISSNAGAEVQRPLATVVIGGLISATLLTLLVLPILYAKFETINPRKMNLKSPILIALVLFGIQKTNGQNLVVNLDSALQLTLENHPRLKAAQLEVERVEELRKSSFSLEPTQVSIARGQLNANAIDYQIQLSQNFDFPTVYQRNKKQFNEQVKLQKIHESKTELELEYELRILWNHWEFLATQEKQLKQQVDLMNQMHKSSERRLQAGASDSLEWTYTLNESRKLSHKLDLLGLELQTIKQQIAWYCGAKNLEPEKPKTYIAMNPSSIVGSANVEVAISQQELTWTESQLALSKAALIPKFNVGYINQQIEGVSNLQGYQLGLGIPIFMRGQRAQISASEKAVEIKQHELASSELNYRMNQLSSQNEIAKKRKALDFQEQMAIKHSKLIRDKAQLQFEAGEINYLQYTSLLESAFETEINHLEAIRALNEAIIQWQKNEGSFN